MAANRTNEAMSRASRATIHTMITAAWSFSHASGPHPHASTTNHATNTRSIPNRSQRRVERARKRRLVIHAIRASDPNASAVRVCGTIYLPGLLMAPSSTHRLEPPRNPGRFTPRDVGKEIELRLGIAPSEAASSQAQACYARADPGRLRLMWLDA